LFFLQFGNEDHIAWLREYRERKDRVKEMHEKQTIDLSALGIDMGLSGSMKY